MFEKTGVASREMVMEKFPSIERINKGPVAVVECYQKIPCNPCQTACPVGAIRIGDDINNIPQRDESRCTGCGICVSRCPGLAIMIVDGSTPRTPSSSASPMSSCPCRRPGRPSSAWTGPDSLSAKPGSSRS